MPWDGSGNFLRVMDWTDDAAAGIKIKADRHDQEDDNFAQGLSNTLTRDGQSSPTADLTMNGFKLIELGAPIAPADAVNKTYVDERSGIVVVSAGAPPTAYNGSLWWDSDSGKLFIRYADADSTQWVEAVPSDINMANFVTKPVADSLYGETWFDWTPALMFSGASVGMTYSDRKGRGVKVNKRVTLWFDITLSNKGSSTGSASIGGFPNPPAAGLLTQFPGTIGYTTAMVAGFANMSCYLSVSSGNITISAPNLVANETALDAAGNGSFTNTSRIAGSVTYEAA